MLAGLVSGERRAYAEHGYCPEWLAPILLAYDWPAGEACEVVRCESGYDAAVVSRPDGRYVGLWQMDADKRVDRTDPVASTAVAYELWRGSGRTFSGHWPGCGAGF